MKACLFSKEGIIICTRTNAFQTILIHVHPLILFKVYSSRLENQKFSTISLNTCEIFLHLQRTKSFSVVSGCLYTLPRALFPVLLPLSLSLALGRRFGDKKNPLPDPPELGACRSLQIRQRFLPEASLHRTLDKANT